jgi:hypothetical protein
MTQVMVRYQVKPDRVADNERLVRAVYAELRAVKPDGFHYVTFRLDDGVTFVHLASTDSHEEPSPLPGLEAFQRFQEGIAERCDVPPAVTPIGEVGSYRAFGDGPQ